MKYVMQKFSCPASNNASELTWDFAFLSREEFVTKHGEKAYAKLQKMQGDVSA